MASLPRYPWPHQSPLASFPSPNVYFITRFNLLLFRALASLSLPSSSIPSAMDTLSCLKKGSHSSERVLPPLLPMSRTMIWQYFPPSVRPRVAFTCCNSHPLLCRSIIKRERKRKMLLSQHMAQNEIATLPLQIRSNDF